MRTVGEAFEGFCERFLYPIVTVVFVMYVIMQPSHLQYLKSLVERSDLGIHRLIAAQALKNDIKGKYLRSLRGLARVSDSRNCRKGPSSGIHQERLGVRSGELLQMPNPCYPRHDSGSC